MTLAMKGLPSGLLLSVNLKVTGQLGLFCPMVSRVFRSRIVRAMSDFTVVGTGGAVTGGNGVISVVGDFCCPRK